MKHFFFLILVFSFSFVYSKNKTPKSYEDYQKKYENYGEDDSRAFSYLNLYIKKAKKEKKYPELFLGYSDAVFFSKSKEKKLQYADSCIDAAYKSANNDRISAAYVLKGSIYYAKLKKYKPALDEYLKAYKFSKDTKDLYLKSKVSYHLGVVKNYLGYHEEALELFKNCVSYFETEAKNPNLHKFEIFNNEKGYLNSLHQMIVCYRYLEDYKKLDSLTDIGLFKTFNNKDFLLEKGYFLKSKGISEYRNNRYESAIKNLEESLTLIKDDFAWISVDYFYIGKSYLALNKEELAIANFKKIDSIFNKNDFILPELRENYEILINHYKANNNAEQQLYYTTQLLKADSIISKDFTYLSLKIHREYETNTLLEEKGRLEKANTLIVFLIVFSLVTGGFLVFIITKKYKKQKGTLKKYSLLEEKLNKHSYHPSESLETSIPVAYDDKKPQIKETIKEDILKKLILFEEKKQFNQKGLTIQKLAIMLETNTNYLSQVINEYKGMNFNRYLGDLRIRHITYLMFEKNIYLNYTIDTLAKECGIASRQNFSDLFFEINGIRPTDFIKRRKKDLTNNTNHVNYSNLDNIRGYFSKN